MRILMLAHYYPPEMGGAAARLHGLARWMVHYGCSVTVVTGFPNYPSGTFPNEYRRKLWVRENLDGVSVVRTWVFVSPKRSSLFRLLNYFSLMISSVLVGVSLPAQDVIVASSPPLFLGVSGWLLSRLKRIPWVFDIRDIWPDLAVESGEFDANSAMAKFGYILARFLYKSADSITPVTEYKATKICQQGASVSRVTVVYNGVDLDDIPQHVNDGQFDLGLEGKFVVLYAGLIGVFQGVEILVPISDALSHYEDIHFLVVGDGVRKESLEQQIRQNELANITLLPRQPREAIASFISLADVCFIPLASSNIDDAIPSKLLEAWAYKKPVVVAAAGEAANLVKNCDGGLSAPPENPDSVAKAIETLYSDDSARSRMATNGSRFVRENLSRSNLAQDMLGVLTHTVEEYTEEEHSSSSVNAVVPSGSGSISLKGQTIGMLRTAKRAGVERTLRRIVRMGRLKFVNPVLGPMLFGRQNTTELYQQPAQEVRLALERIQALYSVPSSDYWNIEQQSLILLNQSPVEFLVPYNWNYTPIDDPLWLFHLHSWEWALPRVTESNRQLLHSLIRDWLDSNPVGKGIGWQPEPTSRRIVSWLLIFLISGVDIEFRNALLQHSEYLKRNLERDLDNNHLIANLKALAWVEFLYGRESGISSKRNNFLDEFWKQFCAQILPDGGHFERSTSYHVTVWKDGIETALLSQACGVNVPSEALSALNAMNDYILAMMRPDGSLPMFDDSVQVDVDCISALITIAGEVCKRTDLRLATQDTDRWAKDSLTLLSESGRAVYRSHIDGRPFQLLFEASELGPAHCPGHGHADALSVNLWYDNHELLIDPGTYQYAMGYWREYFRGSSAHSTAIIDGQNQADFIGPFRVSILPHARISKAEMQDGSAIISGEHDGYQRLQNPVRHQRQVMWTDNSGEIIDTFLGTGRHTVTLLFHLAPCAIVGLGEQGVTASFENGCTLEINFAENSHGKLDLLQGYWSPTWYVKHAAPVIEYEFECEVPTKFETTLKVKSA